MVSAASPGSFRDFLPSPLAQVYPLEATAMRPKCRSFPKWEMNGLVLGGSSHDGRKWLIISPQDRGLWDPSKWPFMANKTGVILTYELGKFLQVSTHGAYSDDHSLGFAWVLTIFPTKWREQMIVWRWVILAPTRFFFCGLQFWFTHHEFWMRKIFGYPVSTSFEIPWFTGELMKHRDTTGVAGLCASTVTTQEVCFSVVKKVMADPRLTIYIYLFILIYANMYIYIYISKFAGISHFPQNIWRKPPSWGRIRQVVSQFLLQFFPSFPSGEVR